MRKKSVLDQAMVALYFNLAAGVKNQLTVHEQQFLKGCMEQTFPALKDQARRLEKNMPTQKKQPPRKKKTWLLVALTVLLILLIMFFLLGCEWIQLAHTEDFFKHPGSGWRGIDKTEEIDLDPARDYYYFLLQEWEGLYWRGPTRTLPDLDILGERS